MADVRHERRLPSRDRVQRGLESLIREHRITIAVVFPLVGAVTLVASAEGLLPEPLAFNALLILFGTLVMRSPVVVGVLPRVDRRAVLALLVLCGYTWAIEYVGVRTGWPYGTFEYGVALGPMLGGAVPVALPLFFVPLVVNAYLLSIASLGRWAERRLARLPLAIALVVVIDVVLDPAAVAIGFWAFDPPGAFYGVPLSNYLGWILSATVGVLLLELAFDWRGLERRLAECPFVLDDFVSFVLLWGGVNLLYGNWLPALAAGILGLLLVRTGPVESALPEPVRRLRRVVEP